MKEKSVFNKHYCTTKQVKVRDFFMEINYDLLPKQKTQKHNLWVEIDLYPYATNYMKN